MKTYYIILCFFLCFCQTKTNNFSELDESYTHEISLSCDAKDIPIRRRMLTKEELNISQLGTVQAKSLNNELIIGKLLDGTPINLIKRQKGWLLVQAKIDGKIIKGYIIDKFCNKNTIKPIYYVDFSSVKNNDLSNNAKWIQRYNMSTNQLFDYTLCFLGGESSYGQLLSFTPINNYLYTANNGIRFKVCVFSRNTNLMIEDFAPKVNIYKNKDDISVGVYEIYNFFESKKMEIHIAEDVSFAFFVISPKFNVYSSCAPLDISQVIDGEVPLMLRK